MPDCWIIVLTTFDEDAAVFYALRSGALSYLLKDAPTDRLYEAIRGAARGESMLQPSVAARLVAEFSRLSEQAPGLKPVPAGTAHPPATRPGGQTPASGSRSIPLRYASVMITPARTKNICW
jgi:DNA-binding NarL/FixJ family response regulator